MTASRGKSKTWYLVGESARHLSLPGLRIEEKQFADGELYIRILEDVKGKNVTVVANVLSNNFHELLFLVDAARRAGARIKRIIIPYLGYARQDKLFLPGEAVSSAVVCMVIAQLGIPVTVIDVHSMELKKHLSFDNVSVLPFLARRLPKKEYTVISPDKGGKVRAGAVANLLRSPLVVMQKERKGYEVSISFSGKINGAALIVDDMISGGATLIEAAKAALQHGAQEVIAIAAHGLFLGDARKKLEKSPIRKIVVSNTLPVKAFGKVEVVDVLPLLKTL